MASNASKLYPEQVTAGLTRAQFVYLRQRGHSIAEAMRTCVDNCIRADTIKPLGRRAGEPARRGNSKPAPYTGPSIIGSTHSSRIVNGS